MGLLTCPYDSYKILIVTPLLVFSPTKFQVWLAPVLFWLVKTPSTANKDQWRLDIT